MRLDYSTSGDSGTPPIIMVHALGTDRRMWDDAVSILQHDFYCITPDLQAAGRSPIPEEPISAEEHAKDLIALADHLGLRGYSLAGCALGGMVAAIVAAQEPERVRALVMTNPGLRNLPQVKDMLRARAVQVVAEGMDCLLPAATERSFHNQPHDERYDLFVERYRAQDPAGYASSVLGFLEIDIERYLPEIKCPTLVVSGGQDILMPTDGSKVVSASVARAQHIHFEDAAHFIPYQAPDRLADEMTRFLHSIA